MIRSRKKTVCMRKAGQDPFSKKIFSKDCHMRLQQHMNICSTVAAPRAGSAAAAITDEGAIRWTIRRTKTVS